MSMRYASLICIVFVSFSSCRNDKADAPAPTNKDCDSSIVSYCSTIKAIVDANCAVSGCHVSGFASGDFSSYPGLKAKASLIKERVDSKSMPLTGSLSEDEIKKIDEWVINGVPEK